MLTIVRPEVDAPVASGVTADELAALAEDGYRYDLLDGELIRVSPAGFEHGRVVLRLGARMALFVEQHNLGEVVAAETGFRLARNPDVVLGPDVAFVRRDRVPPASERGGYLALAPDLVVEVVSPYDRWTYVTAKVEAYLAAGVSLVWVLDPPRRIAMVYRADGTPRRLRADQGDMLDGDAVLPGFQLSLTELFG